MATTEFTLPATLRRGARATLPAIQPGERLRTATLLTVYAVLLVGTCLLAAAAAATLAAALPAGPVGTALTATVGVGLVATAPVAARLPFRLAE